VAVVLESRPMTKSSIFALECGFNFYVMSGRNLTNGFRWGEAPDEPMLSRDSAARRPAIALQ
jgi:hypothetical protein